MRSMYLQHYSSIGSASLFEDGQMKTKLKAFTLAASFSMIGLCFTVSHAATTVDYTDNAQFKFVVVNKLKVNTFDEDLNDSSLFTTETFAQMFNKPLVKIPLNDDAIDGLKKPIKKSTLSALAMVFNDKLQKLVSVFDSNSLTEQNSPVLKHANATKTCNG